MKIKKPQGGKFPDIMLVIKSICYYTDWAVRWDLKIHPELNSRVQTECLYCLSYWYCFAVVDKRKMIFWGHLGPGVPLASLSRVCPLPVCDIYPFDPSDPRRSRWKIVGLGIRWLSQTGDLEPLLFEARLWGQWRQVPADAAVRLKADIQDVFSMSPAPRPPVQVIDFRAHAPSHLVRWVFRVHSPACGVLSTLIQLETQDCD